ncbi:signal recognition particle-like protein, partial [Thalassiosira pseudonana CCMP1335]
QQNNAKKGKEKTVWHDGKGKLTKAALAELDMSKDVDKDNTDTVDDFDIKWDMDQSGEGEEPEEEQQSSGVRGFFSNLLSTNRPLTKSDLDPPLKQMQQLLTSKNVAPSTAQAICEVVERQLLGKKVGTLVGVKRAVRHALEDAVERILCPELGGIGGRAEIKRGKSPYTIVMIGINGVGKSTSLAKIAYYLQSNQCNPLLAACDTFRSGAVEQLSVHASCLSLPLYHQGYAKDPSTVAKAAISKATEDGNDVVLIDTAGRMQNNVPLMKALAKLVTETNPDLVLFVCEALVGNDGMDQLTMFQKALTSGGHTRLIDGIVLTKFDTVSDKVGAALTLTHLTGVPIAFCGTGQKYNHLKPLSVPFVIQSL